MTPISIKRNANQPRTTLEGIPQDFVAWAELVHGWTLEHLLSLGTAWAPEGSNALDYLVSDYVWGTENKEGCVYCNSTERLHRGVHGYFVCSECSGAQNVQKDLDNVAHIAGGFVKQEFPAQPPLF